jgi:RNA polymerase sigma-70 factor, ECF subfamily
VANPPGQDELGTHDREKFDRLIWPLRSHVLRAAIILTGRASDADDLAQETLIKAFTAIKRLPEGSDLFAWLMTILRNARIDQLRSRAHSERQRTTRLEDLAADPPDLSPAAPTTWSNPQDILEAFSDQQIIEALAELPEEIRWTLLLADVEQMDHREVAKLLSVPVGTIKSRAFRGRQMLREILSKMNAP